jgi:hypothetical protein
VSRSRPSLTRVRIVVTFGLLLSAFVTAGLLWSALADSRGTDAVAEIVKVEHRGFNTFLTVRFTPSDGKPCESYFRLFPDRPVVGVGDHIQIHYPNGDACINVREASEPTSWVPVVLGVLFTIGLAVGTYMAWSPPTIPPP